MSVSRISSTYMVDRGVFDLQNNLSLMAKLQNQISSGKNISAPSDDPVGLTQLLRLNLEEGQDSQYASNISDALGELGATDTAITSVINVSQRASELAVQASNGTNSSDQLSAISQEVDSLLNQLVQVGNTTFAGKYIFSGFQTDTAPFTVAGQDITYNGTPNTVPFQREVEVAQGSTVPVNVNGDDLLGHVNVVANVANGQGLLYDLTKFKIDLKNNDFTNIRADIDLINNDQSSIQNLQTSVGGITNQLEMTQNRIQDRKLVQDKQISQIQDVDMPSAISNLNFQQTVYQASLGVMAKIMQTSLVNFLGTSG